ncbi:hypothetical protein DFP72DRAFT_822694 [Ephemerocybe angulata]|uniref:Uncharacterized protein n=1 Tax=Ephemerocybe angulata TaxID=980116 RepID=A0A8H6LXS4_9AGAR|nr:hypothetical protein DFP72DRAFT_822694 [Tulosesus angulatus]
MSPRSSKRSTYTGSKRRLVLAFDIGTTYSGISYCILDPGQAPEIRGVTRFPAHEQVSGASKIPTVLYYDREGKMTAAGAEACREGIYETATEEGWEKAQWFKMHVRSQRGTTMDFADRLPPIPAGKTVVQVLADFMQYLYQCARAYISDTHANGQVLWASVESDIDYVISHPNGWEGYQQSQMCEAVALAGLIADSDLGKSRITFVTEGEASLHYAIRNGLSEEALENGHGIVIVDAGGGTVDVSAYRKRVDDGKGRFEEIAVPQCHFFGSVFVSIQAKLFLSELLSESFYLEDLDHIVDQFDTTTKLRFRNDSEPQFIRFGGNRDSDPTCGIRFGQLKISGSDVANFFAPSLRCIISAIQTQVEQAHNPVSHVILVGGFASSDWLYGQVVEALADKSLAVIRPENYVNKAVSDGAVSFYLRRRVRTRVSKYGYGAFYSINYKDSDPEHRLHDERGSVFVSATGRKRIRGSFKLMIPKNTKIEERKEYRSSSTYRFSKLETLKKVRADIWCYRGRSHHPRWKDEEPDMYSKLCQIVMDISHVPYKTLPALGKEGTYFEIEYDNILYYHGIELKAQMAWRENGVEKRSPAQVVYDPND